MFLSFLNYENSELILIQEAGSSKRFSYLRKADVSRVALSMRLGFSLLTVLCSLNPLELWSLKIAQVDFSSPLS